MVSDLRQACARLLVVGFPGREVDRELRGLVDAGVLGAILFGRNVGTAGETALLIRELKSRAGRPFPVAVDQEGGRVARLRGAPYTALPPMRVIGQRADAETARQVGRLLAFELRATGFDWDFAPVLDVDSNPANPVIGDRSFGANPAEVSRLGVALAEGMERAGVASCGKHFPGHGDTLQDSHVTLPVLEHALPRLEAVELVPFRAYAQAGLASVMTAHVRFPALGEDVAATMSRASITGLLRERVGFQGVAVSDDLEMKAIADPTTAAVEAVRAGVDVLLVCHHAAVQHRVLDALVAAARSGQIPEERLRDAHARIDVLVQRFVRPAEDRLAELGSPEHRRRVEEVALGSPPAVVAGRDPTARPDAPG
ncbi:MAG TPA: beta-N-acetylhexosaminidase [Myxococcaceae bacterium]|nr:beta-N-acetylhexosaminidase [Myxococcaceae bacterium]